MTDDMSGGDAETRYMLAMERIATALEALLKERTQPKNTKRIRVKYLGDEREGNVLEFALSPVEYVVVKHAKAIEGQPGLFIYDACLADGEGPARRIINLNSIDPRHSISVPLVTIRERERDAEGCPVSFTPGEYLVTVDLGPDPATWGWREWVRL